MRKLRKGFTLVELLIVVAILATLSATMLVSISGSTAKAKAAAIAQNVETLKSAAAMFYIKNMENSTALTDTKAYEVLDEFIPTWRDFTTGTITYTADGTGRENWVVTVDFSGDGEAAAIKTALGNIKGYGTYKDTEDGDEIDRLTGNKFKVTLWNGKIAQVTH